MPRTTPTIRNVIKDCGGIGAVARALDLSNQTVHEWAQQDRLPFSDLKRQGGTRYSEKLAKMQQKGTLTAAEIRRIGLRV